MEKTSVCPYCNGKMTLGSIHGDRYALKWVSEEKDKGPLLQWFSKGIKLGHSIESFYCDECRKIIIDEEMNTD